MDILYVSAIVLFFILSLLSIRWIEKL